jgi:hypothetical protein
MMSGSILCLPMQRRESLKQHGGRHWSQKDSITVMYYLRNSLYHNELALPRIDSFSVYIFFILRHALCSTESFCLSYAGKEALL